MPAACARTSAGDHRSKANVIDLRSRSRNSGLTCAAKLTVSSGPGKATVLYGSVPDSVAVAVAAVAVVEVAVVEAVAAGAGGQAGPQFQLGTVVPVALDRHSSY